MKITVLMVVTYILWCIRIGTKPCKYFQLNSPYFDRKNGIYSKIAIDKLIPDQWRLQQFYDDGQRQPERYPVFAKPEWGQNAKGVIRANNAEELTAIRNEITGAQVRYMIQEAATGAREFEIFSIRHDQDKSRFAVFTVTEAVNTSETNPVNSIYNENTRYAEITDQFTDEEQTTVWQHVEQIGRFNISRMSVRADSIPKLLEGEFQVIEINLFLPMPINMLDQKYNWPDLWGMIRRYMLCLAKITRARDKTLETKPVFTKIMLYDRRSKILNYLRSKL